MTNFVQFAHGLLVDVENFARRHSEPLPSFNPHPDDLPGAPDASPVPLTSGEGIAAYTAPAATETVEHTPAAEAPAEPAATPESTPASDADAAKE